VIPREGVESVISVREALLIMGFPEE